MPSYGLSVAAVFLDAPCYGDFMDSVSTLRCGRIEDDATGLIKKSEISAKEGLRNLSSRGQDMLIDNLLGGLSVLC
jgi:hypothetical protein